MAAIESIAHAAIRQRKFRLPDVKILAMANDAGIKLCCITHCPERAVTAQSGPIGQWIVVLPYCEEHGRDAREGTPLGGVGIDSSRVLTSPSDEAVPQVDGRLPGID